MSAGQVLQAQPCCRSRANLHSCPWQPGPCPPKRRSTGVLEDFPSQIPGLLAKAEMEGNGRDACMQIGKSCFCGPVSHLCPKTDDT